MAQGTQEFSLKAGGKWSGIVDTSDVLPQISGATFSSLIGCYHNRDGTELRRWLGSLVVGQPFLGMLRQVYQVQADTPTSGTATVHVAHQWDQTVADNRYPHFGPEASAGTFNIYMLDSSVIADGIYAATWVSEYSFTITVSATGSEAAGAGTGRCFIQRIYAPHVLTHAGGRPVVIAETQSFDTTGVTDKRNIGSWVASGVLDPSNVLGPGYPQNTQGAELAADSGFISWPSPTVEPHWGDWAEMLTSTEGNTGDEIIWTMNILRRVVADVLNRRILIAVPGHGCMFEANIAREDLPFQVADLFGNPSQGTLPVSDAIIHVVNHRFTKALGIPRGIFQNNTASGAGVECQFMQVGYIDSITGEVGLPSFIDTIDVDSTETVTVTVYTPRNALAETYGLDIVLYLSERDAAAVQVLIPFSTDVLRDDEQMVLNAGSGSFHVRAVRDIDQAFSTTINSVVPVDPNRVPTIEQMPRGASWVRVVRSRMFAGGDRPSSFKTYVVADSVVDPITSGLIRVALRMPTGNSSDWNLGDLRCDGYILSSAYEGARLAYYVNLDQELSVRRLRTASLGQKMNDPGYQASGGPSPDGLNDEQLFLFPDRESFGVSAGIPGDLAYIQTDPLLVQVAEENVPGVVAATTTLPVDTIEGVTTTGVARLGDTALIFTDRSTRIFQWGLLPRIATSTTLSTQYGCIAPASIVEGPGFVTWLSDQGPMLYQGGSLQRPWLLIADLWQTFVSESDGLMTNAQAIHDRERQLVIWQVTTDHDDSSSDATKSKTTCSHLLVWNYATLAFTLIRRPTNARPHAIGMLPINDSANSQFFWAPAFVCPVGESAFYPIHFMDEGYSDRSADPNTFTANAARSSGSDVFATASTISGVGQYDECFIRGPGGILRWWGRVSSTSGTNITLDDSGSGAPSTTDGADWKSGDVLENQVIHMQLSTNYMRQGELGRKTNVRAVSLRTESYKRSDATYTTYMWARVRVEKEDGTVVSLTRNPWGDAITDGITRFVGGFAGAKHFKVHVDIISNIQVHIQDIAIEAEPQA